ncbi:MAG: HlyC/CorC family transporter [Acidobacteria bacterium]|nr:HlyC/CorC family transporter [Acidobacteriota bacterium]
MVTAVVILALILLNGFFAMSEIAVVSARKPRLLQMPRADQRRVQLVLRLQANPESMLSVVQIGITLVGIVAGAFGAVELADDVAPSLAAVPALAPWAPQIAYFLIVLGLTYVTLVVGELVPKAFALRRPEAVAVRVAPVMSAAARVMHPFVVFLEGSTRVILRLFGFHGPPGAVITAEEVRFVIDQGAAQGVLAEKENELIRNVFRLAERQARSVMTSRQDVCWLDVNAPRRVNHRKIVKEGFTRYPVCEGSLEKIVGILDVKDYWRVGGGRGRVALRALVSPAVYVPENQSAFTTLETLQSRSVHLAVVLDEYGATEGIVTLHDLVENIFGTMPDAVRGEGEAIFAREDGSLLVDGTQPFDEIAERLGIVLEPEVSRPFSTLGGYMMFRLKKVPRTGDHLEADGFRFEIVDMDGPRVDKVLVRQVSAEGAAPGPEKTAGE